VFVRRTIEAFSEGRRPSMARVDCDALVRRVAWGHGHACEDITRASLEAILHALIRQLLITSYWYVGTCTHPGEAGDGERETGERSRGGETQNNRIERHKHKLRRGRHSNSTVGCEPEEGWCHA
jgi:hypothetical protein